MLKGGYQIIDLADKEHTLSVGVEHEGIYEKIEGTRKAILLSGINIGGTEYHDTFVELTVSDSNYTGTVYGKTITISDEDVVTITEIASDSEEVEPDADPEATE